MKKRRIILFAGLAVLVILLLLNRRIVYYGYVQAKGQLYIIWHSEPVGKIMNNPQYPDSLKYKLKLVEEIKLYAVDNLGLKGVRNYTTYFDQKGAELMWVVSGCEPYKLESYKWRFPILGEFSYKGFFVYDMAVEEMDELKEMGLDASIRTAGGWSTLGLLKDPVLSNMLERDEGALADLIIHELTHGTIFIKDSLEFNENLASFIGNNGAKLFLTDKYGPSSDILRSYEGKLADSDKFTQYVLDGAEALDSLYNSFPQDMPVEEKLELKQKAIREFRHGLGSLSFRSAFYTAYFRDFTPDNTFFMSYLRYRGGKEIFERNLRDTFDGDLPKYIESLKSEYER